MPGGVVPDDVWIDAICVVVDEYVTVGHACTHHATSASFVYTVAHRRRENWNIQGVGQKVEFI